MRNICLKNSTHVDEAGSLYFDDGIFPWKLADDFSEDVRWGYPAGRWSWAGCWAAGKR